MEETPKETISDFIARDTWTFDDFNQLIETLSETGDTADKLRELVGKLEAENPDPKGASAVKLGIGLYMVSRFQQALDVLSLGTDNRDRRYFQAQCQKHLGHHERAIEELELAKARGWENPDIDLEIVEALAMAGDLDKAAKNLKSLTSKLGETSGHLCMQGLLSELTGEIEAAGQAYEQAVQIDETNPTALFRLAYFNDLYGEEEQAMELYQQCLALQPVHVGALMNMAVLYEDAEDYDQACFCLRRILAINPSHWRARLFLRDAESSKTMYFDEDRAKLMAQRNAILETPVTDFELSVRARNCLKKMDINTLGDLVNTPETRLLEYKNFGETSLKEIRDMLALKGLRLGQALEDAATAELSGMFISDTPSQARDGVMATPLSQIELSVRARKALETLKIDTLGDLVSRTEAELLACRNFGQTSLNTIRQALGQYGLRLAESD
ncbi:MAG: DNA-directed RNA polymerase subunit alpha C-terminal domain-containing protein [Phycisphaerae bacterium]|jgi:DNA-directed RNA polymerase subunit alpha|nr:DNA-directed RNA polymerase subunit alpha C-terminal domain-containing protein [Phycisphaerae bacterium]